MVRAAVVGATGIVGQQFLTALEGHPWIKVTGLAASERSAGKAYVDALRAADTGALRWYAEGDPPSDLLEMVVQDARQLKPGDYDVIFTAIESDQAEVLEPLYAQTTPVISTASTFRYDTDVPILIPGVNDDHGRLLVEQQQRRGWKGFVTPIPNCTTMGLAMTLKPLLDAFGIEAVVMTSMQAISGAGRSPGVAGLDILDNVIPFIPKEEEKVERETQKILGRLRDASVVPAVFPVSATCTRVNVLEGHTESVSVSTRKPCTPEDAAQAMRAYAGRLREQGLPTAPEELLVVKDDPFRPQPRLDRNAHDGMATVVGRIREDRALANGIKYMLVSHNTKMGAAKGAVLVAEILGQQGFVRGMPAS